LAVRSVVPAGRLIVDRLERTERTKIMIDVLTLVDQLALFESDVALDCAGDAGIQSAAIAAAQTLLRAATLTSDATDGYGYGQTVNRILAVALSALDVLDSVDAATGRIVD
jgi:hypothetical protein